MVIKIKVLVKVTNEQVELFNNWLKYYRDENKDATHTGVYVGVKFSLESMGLYDKVVWKKENAIVEIEKEIVDILVKKMKENSVNAMYNIGLASGIYWVLDELNLYKQ